MSERASEPTNVGPIAGGNLRASDADRDQVATLLSTAYAEGRLTREEHDERVGQLMVAKTFDDLIPITRDLVPAANSRPTPLTPSRAARSRSTPPVPPTSPTGMSPYSAESPGPVAGGSGARSRPLALFGGIDLDLREAIFEGPMVEMSGFWCFGGLDIKVPEGIEVRDQTVGHLRRHRRT